MATAEPLRPVAEARLRRSPSVKAAMSSAIAFAHRPSGSPTWRLLPRASAASQ